MENFISISKDPKHTPLVRALYLIVGIVLTVSLCGMYAMTSHAANGLTMSTQYSDISVQAGETLTFSLNMLYSGGTCNAKLSASNLPDGWDGYFKGGSYEISSVSVTDTLPDTTPSYSLTIPDTAEEGTYTITLLADAGDDISASLDLNITVKAQTAGDSTYTVQYPEQEGASGTTFSFSGTIANNSVADSSYSLSTQAPTGWTVTYKPSGDSTQINSIDVASGSSEGITISVAPPSDIEPGDYNISLGAASSSETLSSTVKVTITGTYNLSVSTPDQVLSMDAYANHQSDITIDVTNNGNVDLNNISLSADGPDNWTMDFEEDTIDTLAAGQTQEVVCHVTPDSSAITGDYLATITASTDGTTADTQIRVTVKTRTIWGIIGLLLIVIVCGGLAYIIRKYGRR